MLILEIDEEPGLDVVVVNAPEFARVEVKNVLGSKTESRVIITLLARAVAVAVGRRSGGRLATTLVATKNVFIFFFTFSLFHFLRRDLFS